MAILRNAIGCLLCLCASAALGALDSISPQKLRAEVCVRDTGLGRLRRVRYRALGRGLAACEREDHGGEG